MQADYELMLDALRFFGPLTMEELRRKLAMRNREIGRKRATLVLTDLLRKKQIRRTPKGNGWVYALGA